MLTISEQTQTSPLTFTRHTSSMEMMRLVTAFPKVALEETANLSLQDRVDTKYLIRTQSLPALLAALPGSYAVVNVEDELVSPNRTLYFDTQTYRSYFDHHNGKHPRNKVRMRTYENTMQTFLEIKHKNNNLRTIKHRMQIPHMSIHLSLEMREFLGMHFSGEIDTLIPTSWNAFTRVTLINTKLQERVTLDTDLQFYDIKNRFQLPHLAVVEVKQPSYSRNSFLLQALKKMGYQPTAFSKYCTGMVMLNPQLKRNQFKKRFHTFQAMVKRTYTNELFNAVRA